MRTEVADLDRLRDGGDAQAVSAGGESGRRGRPGAMAVAAGFDHREELDPGRQQPQDSPHVVGDGTEVDLGPALKVVYGAALPARSSLRTIGISSRRSEASSPASPIRCEIRRPASAWT